MNEDRIELNGVQYVREDSANNTAQSKDGMEKYCSAHKVNEIINKGKNNIKKFIKK